MSDNNNFTHRNFSQLHDLLDRSIAMIDALSMALDHPDDTISNDSAVIVLSQIREHLLTTIETIDVLDNITLEVKEGAHE